MATIKRHAVIHDSIQNYLNAPHDAFTTRKHDYIITSEAGVITVQLHGNMIFAYNKTSDTIYLSTCGYATRTTCKVINACLSNLSRTDKTCIRQGVVYYGDLSLDCGTKGINRATGNCVLDSVNGIKQLQDNGKL